MKMNKFFLLLIIAVSFSNSSDIACTDEKRCLKGSFPENQLAKLSILLLPCDTMIIGRGDEFRVGKNTYIAFRDPMPENLIIVEGTLLFSGTDKERVRISSSLDTSSLFASSMEQPWKGIVVQGKGELIMKSTMIYGAHVPACTYSEEVEIRNSYFFKANHLMLPGTVIYDLSEINFIDTLIVSDYLAGLKKNPPDYSHLPEVYKKRPFWKSKWTWIGAGTAAAAGIIVYYVLTVPEPEETHF
jgi:hypothetical protein